MAHLPTNTAIFSPSVARAAATAAKDWNFVDAWLSSKFHGRTPPAFERNPDTLRALLALASANEAADEERDLLARVEASALREAIEAEKAKLQIRRQQTTNAPRDAVSGGDDDDDAAPATTLDDARATIFAALEDSLPREGQTALTALATTSTDLGIAFPDPVTISQRLIALQAELHELEQAAARVTVLQRYVASEAEQSSALLASLQEDPQWRPANDLAKQNLETQRRVKALGAQVPEGREKGDVAAVPGPTIEQVRKEEEEFLALLAKKRDLDAQIQAFQGLPPDAEQARKQLEELRSELRHITQRRDALFEGLVERETPRKPMR